MGDSRLQCIGNLDIAEDIDFEQKSWRVQRVAWVIMTMILIAALLGLFGDGWLSRRHTATPNQDLTLIFDRFVRLNAPAELRFRIARSLTDDGTVGLWLSADYLQQVELKRLMPEPREEIVTDDGIIFRFDVQPNGNPLGIEFQIKIRSAGSLRGEAATVDVNRRRGGLLSFAQWAYP